MIRNFIILILLLIPILSFGQGKVTRPQKQATHQSVVPKKNDIKEPTFGTVNGHDWVDLGLPSGTKWATCNVGASAPYDCGLFVSWGALSVPKDGIYSLQNAPLYGKVVQDISGNSFYDVARVEWNAPWRIPSKTEFEELSDHCEIKPLFINGIKGCVITGPNGNTIFLPFNMVKINDEAYDDSGTAVEVWTSSENDLEWSYVGICEQYRFLTSGSRKKNEGLPVRPVFNNIAK